MFLCVAPSTASLLRSAREDARALVRQGRRLPAACKSTGGCSNSDLILRLQRLQVESFESTLVNFVWMRRARDSPTSSPTKSMLGTPASGMSTPDWSAGDPFAEKLKHEFSSADIPILLDDVERDSGPRPAMLYGPIYTGLAFSINWCLTGLLFRSLWKECLYDGNYQRMVLMAVAPFQVSSLSRRVRRPSEGDVLPSSRSACFVCSKRGYLRAATDFPPLQYATSALWARPATRHALTRLFTVSLVSWPISSFPSDRWLETLTTTRKSASAKIWDDVSLTSHSGIAPVRLTSDLPHVTIVMPVCE